MTLLKAALRAIRRRFQGRIVTHEDAIGRAEATNAAIRRKMDLGPLLDSTDAFGKPLPDEATKRAKQQGLDDLQYGFAQIDPRHTFHLPVTQTRVIINGMDMVEPLKVSEANGMVTKGWMPEEQRFWTLDDTPGA